MRIKPTNWQTQVKIFEKYGCIFIRQKGDHLIFHHKNAKRAVVIPKYDEIPVTVTEQHENGWNDKGRISFYSKKYLNYE